MCLQAGLFSAVLTAFIIEGRKDLREDYSKTSADLLRTLVSQSQNTPSAPVLSTFVPPRKALRVNSVWFASLSCSLISALAAMLGKQWVRQYTNNLLSGGAYLIRARRHQYALEATERWRMSGVIHAIPIFIHLALFLFFIGLFISLWGDDAALVGTVFSISLTGLLLYLILTILPGFFPDCPFGTPLSFFVMRKAFDPSASIDDHPHSRSKLDTKCLTWLMRSTSTTVVRSATMAISGLEGTGDQQAALHKSGALEAAMQGIESCSLKERKSFVIKHEDVDAASLFLFAALRLDPMGDRAVIDLVNRFDLQQIVCLRNSFNAADLAAAMWCIAVFNFYLRIALPDTQASKTLASKFLLSVDIDRWKRIDPPGSGRCYKDLLAPSIELASSTSPDNRDLFEWAVMAMFISWRCDGLSISFDEAGISVIARAATMMHDDDTILSWVFGRVSITVQETLLTGAIGPILDTINADNPKFANSAIRLLRQIAYADVSLHPLIG